ncbi:hypothetical protein V6259_13070 [Marinomonas sp. TI.3.20]|uniref:hypothetical protein n=1 Tax=Marinomonas sp. TI.3.20 TaxID=3121296 RepID=UPI00311D7421
MKPNILAVSVLFCSVLPVHAATSGVLDGIKSFFQQEKPPSITINFNDDTAQKLKLSAQTLQNLFAMGENITLSNYYIYSTDDCTVQSSRFRKIVETKAKQKFSKNVSHNINSSDNKNAVKDSTDISQLIQSWQLHIDSLKKTKDGISVEGKLNVTGFVLKHPSSIAMKSIRESLHDGYKNLMVCYKDIVQQRSLLD